MISSEINNSIEEHSQQVISAMPKTLRDIDRLNYEINRLSTQISTFYDTLSLVSNFKILIISSINLLLLSL